MFRLLGLYVLVGLGLGFYRQGDAASDRWLEKTDPRRFRWIKTHRVTWSDVLGSVLGWPLGFVTYFIWGIADLVDRPPRGWKDPHEPTDEEES